MDSVLIVRVVSGIMAIAVLVVLVLRMRKNAVR